MSSIPNILEPFQAFVMQKLTMEAVDGPVKGNLLIGGKTILEIVYFPNIANSLIDN